VAALQPEARTRRVHYDWLEAGENTQRTVAQLSQQLRRFLDDAAFLENRRIMELLHGIESCALALRGNEPKDAVIAVDAMSADIELPLERPLFAPSLKTRIDSAVAPADGDEIDTARLFDQVVIDKSAMAEGIRQALRSEPQISLRQLVERRPLALGLAELMAYLQLAHDGSGGADFRAVIDDSVSEPVRWRAQDAQGAEVTRQARLPRVIYVRR
jgi:hypothetical protein